LVEFVQIPVLPLVEDFGGFSKRRLVLISGTAEEEMLTLLLSYYPDPISTSQIYKDMNRRPKSTVANTRTSLYNDKLIEGDPKLGYKLTILGYRSATEIAKQVAGMVRTGR
jgi:Mn-dependent DtxR family transcriptional regulator